MSEKMKNLVSTIVSDSSALVEGEKDSRTAAEKSALTIEDLDNISAGKTPIVIVD